MPRYTYLEPMFDIDIRDNNPDFIPLTNLTANGPVYLAKEDNVVSEQTFGIFVQTSDSIPPGEGISPATINVDYRIGRLDPVITFSPNQQRVLFSFQLLLDIFPEGTEAFLASSTAADSGEISGMRFDYSEYLPPIRLAAETFIIIEDDDCKPKILCRT